MRNCAIFIIGPSGSGKSTLTHCLQQVYTFLDIKTTVINLDCANESTNRYKPDIDVNQLIKVEEVMEEFGIGPNAAVLYCMEFLQKNSDWLLDQLKETTNSLLIFDLPGQIELYVNHESLNQVIRKIQKMDIQCCILQLFDCTYAYDLKHFISMCAMSLASMINLELPHINVFNKIDLMKGRRLGTHLYDYLNATSLSEMVEFMNVREQDQPLLTAITKVIDQYGIVSFTPMDVQRIELVAQLIFEIGEILGTLVYHEHSRKFKEFIKKYYKSSAYDKEAELINLEIELFDQDNGEEQFQKALKSDKSG